MTPSALAIQVDTAWSSGALTRRRKSLVAGADTAAGGMSLMRSSTRDSSSSSVSNTLRACSCMMAVVRWTMAALSRHTAAWFSQAAAVNSAAGTTMAAPSSSWCSRTEDGIRAGLARASGCPAGPFHAGPAEYGVCAASASPRYAPMG